MAELKTKLSDASVEVFLDGIADEAKRRYKSYAILAMMQEPDRRRSEDVG